MNEETAAEKNRLEKTREMYLAVIIKAIQYRECIEKKMAEICIESARFNTISQRLADQA